MRKLYWWGAGCLVVGAFAVCMAANHASHQPDSCLGRCVIPGAREQPRPAAGPALIAAVRAAINAFSPLADRAPEGPGKPMARPEAEQCAEGLPAPQFVEA